MQQFRPLFRYFYGRPAERVAGAHQFRGTLVENHWVRARRIRDLEVAGSSLTHWTAESGPSRTRASVTEQQRASMLWS